MRLVQMDERKIPTLGRSAGFSSTYLEQVTSAISDAFRNVKLRVVRRVVRENGMQYGAAHAALTRLVAATYPGDKAVFLAQPRWRWSRTAPLDPQLARDVAAQSRGSAARLPAAPAAAVAPEDDRPPASASVSSAAAASSTSLSASPSRRRSMGATSASAAAAAPPAVDEYEYECPTCWEDVSFQACVSCSEGHLVCSDCLKRHAEENLFAKHHSQLDCLSKNDSGAKCGGFYSHAMLARALPEKMLQRHAATSAKEAVDALGGLENLVSCPHCDWTAELPANNRVLTCGNAACRKETCRYCRKASHIPLRCDEVKEKKKTDARTAIEERMTAARLRQCWGCKISFFKTEGCNKMTCPKCGKMQCYSCNAKIIVGRGADGAPPALLPNGRPACYAHFCEVPHCDHSNCGKCRLFDNSTEVEDLKRVRDAGISAEKALRAQASAARSAGDDGGGGDVAEQVDMDKLLDGTAPPPREKRKRRLAAPHNPARPPPAGRRAFPLHGAVRDAMWGVGPGADAIRDAMRGVRGAMVIHDAMEAVRVQAQAQALRVQARNELAARQRQARHRRRRRR